MHDNRRYYSLDALRGIMMMLGVVIHGSAWYMSEPLYGSSADPSTSYLFDIVVLFIHSFRMQLFFILAGFFTSLLVEKRGLRGTYSNRAKRILGPLLISIITILPFALLFMMAILTSARFDTHQIFPTKEQFEIMTGEMAAVGIRNEFMIAHLWFLYYLLYFYLTIPLCMIIVKACRPVHSRIDRWLANPAILIFFGMKTLPWKALKPGLLLEDRNVFITWASCCVKPHVMKRGSS